MNKIKIAIVGMGNCASSLIQGIHYYDGKNPDDAIGLMHWDIGGYSPSDIDVVAAFDIDARKVGKSIDEAIFAKPNCTTIFQEEIPKYDVCVSMGMFWMVLHHICLIMTMITLLLLVMKNQLMLLKF